MNFNKLEQNAIKHYNKISVEELMNTLESIPFITPEDVQRFITFNEHKKDIELWNKMNDFIKNSKPPVELTFSEIESRLGYKIKIVG